MNQITQWSLAVFLTTLILIAAAVVTVSAVDRWRTRSAQPCPIFTMHETGGRHGVPRFVSFRRADFDAYTEAVRRYALGECVITEGME